MKRKSLERLGAVLGSGAAATAASAIVFKGSQRRWNATGEETARPLPLDDQVRQPTYVTNRAITVRARAEQIWLWIGLSVRLSPRAGPTGGAGRRLARQKEQPLSVHFARSTLYLRRASVATGPKRSEGSECAACACQEVIIRFSSSGPPRVEKDGPFDNLARDQDPRLLPRVAAK